MKVDGPPLGLHDFASAPIEDLGRQLDYQQGVLDGICARMESTLEKNRRNSALYGLMQRTAWENRRLTDVFAGPVEEVAWHSRNLFELGLIVRYVLDSKDNLAQWLGQKLQDEKEMLEGFIELGGDQAPGTPILRTGLSNLEAQCSEQGLRFERHISTSTLADHAGIRGEYDAFFKMSSKFVHPTSWLVNSSEEDVHHPAYRTMLIWLASLHVFEILARILPQVGFLDDDPTHVIDHLAPWLNRKT